MTKADLAAFKLSDLTRFGQPHLIKVSKQEITQLEQADRRSGHLASLAPHHQAPAPHRASAPSDYVPPSLPEGAITFDGSILPPKHGGGRAVLDVGGHLPGASLPPGLAASGLASPQHFSIE